MAGGSTAPEAAHQNPRESRWTDPAWLPARLVLFTVVISTMEFAGLALARLDMHITTLWPAKGMLLAALLFSKRRNGPYLIALAATASLAAKLTFGDPLFFALVTTFISVSSAAATAFVFRAIAGAERVDFRDWRMLALFFAVACAAATLAAVPGAGLLSVTRGVDFLSAFIGWSFATGLSYLLFVPPLVLLAPTPNDGWVPASPAFAGANPGMTSPSSLEIPASAASPAFAGASVRADPLPSARAILLSALGMATITLIAFNEPAFPVFYLIAVALVIVSVAAGIEAAAVGVLVTALIAVPAVLRSGHWPNTYFHGVVELRLIATQVFIIALSIGILPAAAAVSERNRLRLGQAKALADLHAASSKLAESEERYRTLAEKTKDVIARADSKAVIRYISPGVRALGYEPEELVGTTGAEFVHPDDLGNFLANTQALLTGTVPKTPPVREHRFRTKSGEWMWLEGNPTVLHDADGKPAEIVNVFRDISDRKAMDTALADATREAEAAAVAKAEFLANMSHELRTPLTSIIGFSQLLAERKDLPDTASRHVARVVQAGQALLALVNDILDFSKLEAGQIEIRPEPCEPERVARDALELFTPQAARKSVTLSLRAGASLPPTLLLDEGRVRQVILNLVGNAVKFTEAGTVTLSLAYAKGALRCEVADTGPGIPKDKLGVLFQRFSQVDGTHGRAHGGTGLGLAICKGLIEAMGGEIFVTSEEGKGSTFGFDIPAAPDAKTAAAKPGIAEALSGLSVLAADDNVANRNLLEAMLKPLGVVLTLAENGASAVRLARAHVFDVILMDVHMPDMNGADAAGQIRTESQNRTTPIFAFTADTGIDLTAARNTVFDGIMLKPLTLSALKKALRETAKAA